MKVLVVHGYKEKRMKNYPSLEDQLDAMWKGGQDLEDMRNKILDIKDKYKKPDKGVDKTD